jgi:hypothetical protein
VDLDLNADRYRFHHDERTYRPASGRRVSDHQECQDRYRE